jgi:hypothetical protein
MRFCKPYTGHEASGELNMKVLIGGEERVERAPKGCRGIVMPVTLIFVFVRMRLLCTFHYNFYGKYLSSKDTVMSDYFEDERELMSGTAQPCQ